MNLIKCHISYLFTKNTSIILMLTTFVFSVAFIGNASFNEGLRSEAIYEYYLNSYFISKVLLAFIAIFICANSIYFKNDFYAYFILTNIKRKKYIITKIIVNVLVLGLLSAIVFTLFLLIGFIMIKGFYIKLIYIETFINITLIIIIYGLYAFLFMQLFNNQFINIFVFGLLIISNNLDTEVGFAKLLLFIIPHEAHYGVIHLVWLLLILAIVNISIYLNKDLNYLFNKKEINSTYW